MKRSVLSDSLLVVLLAACALIRPGLLLSEVPRIDKAQLLKLIDDPNVTILDVRTNQDWTAATQKIKGAVREKPAEFPTWAMKYPKDRRYVLY